MHRDGSPVKAALPKLEPIAHATRIKNVTRAMIGDMGEGEGTASRSDEEDGSRLSTMFQLL